MTIQSVSSTPRRDSKLAPLIGRYPRLIKRRIKAPFRYGGFPCGDGWLAILATLFSDIEQRSDGLRLEVIGDGTL